MSKQKSEDTSSDNRKNDDRAKVSDPDSNNNDIYGNPGGPHTNNRDVMASTGIGSGNKDPEANQSVVTHPTEGRIRNDDVIRDEGNVPVIVLNNAHQPVPMPGGVDNRKWASIVQLSDTSWGIMDLSNNSTGPTTYDSAERANKAAKDHGFTIDSSMNEDRRGKGKEKTQDKDKGQDKSHVR